GAARRAARAGPPARAPGGGGAERALLVAGASLEADDVVGRDLERDPLLAVATLELAGAEAALDEHAVALAQVLRRPLGTVAPDGDPEPVGRLHPFAGLLVLRALVDRDAELGHRAAVGRVAHLGIAPEVADNHRLRERRHSRLLFSRWPRVRLRSRTRRSARRCPRPPRPRRTGARTR